MPNRIITSLVQKTTTVIVLPRMTMQRSRAEIDNNHEEPPDVKARTFAERRARGKGRR